MNRKSDLELLDKMEKIRSKNNTYWMDILRLAFKHAPKDARKLLRNIVKCDNKLSKLDKELINNHE